MVSFVPENKKLNTIYFHDLNELNCDQSNYDGSIIISFTTKSLKNSITVEIQKLTGKFGNLIIDSDYILYGAFLSINIKYEYPNIKDPFFNTEINSSQSYCIIDFQFAGALIGSDVPLNFTSSTESVSYENKSETDNEPKIEVNVIDLKRKITFK